jgi:hypothetical protein
MFSAWENGGAVPHARWLSAYAAFFATRRSVEQDPYRLIPEKELTASERARREELRAELNELKARAENRSAKPVALDVGFWSFPANEDITIVCARLPPQFTGADDYVDPDSPDYVALYTYADLDALILLYGHIRARNPLNKVNYRAVDELVPEDFVTHLVLLGGVDWNDVTRNILEAQEKLPVSQIARENDADPGGFEVETADGPKRFSPVLEDGHLRQDVAHLYRGRNPHNRKMTVTICNGQYGRGTVGVVRALIDDTFRESNQQYLDHRFGGRKSFSILSRVDVGYTVIPPDWTVPEYRLHEWTEAE